jgi:Putative addiction module component
MSPKAADLMKQAQKLTDEERRELAIELLDSAIEPEIQAAWIDESRRRVAEVDSGQVATLSNEEALRIIAADD